MSISSRSLDVTWTVFVMAVGAVMENEDHAVGVSVVGTGLLSASIGPWTVFWSMAMSIVEPLLSSSVRIVRRVISVRATITPTRLTNWIGWLL